MNIIASRKGIRLSTRQKFMILLFALLVLLIACTNKNNEKDCVCPNISISACGQNMTPNSGSVQFPCNITCSTYVCNPLLNTSAKIRPAPPILAEWVDCEGIKDGWLCRFNLTALFTRETQRFGNNNQTGIGEQFPTIVGRYQQMCANADGKWYCPGFCKPEYDHFCYMPYADANKTCHNSDECLGKCVIGNSYDEGVGLLANKSSRREKGENIICPDCIGHCSKYSLHQCEWWFELNNGVISDRSFINCD